MSNSQVPLKDEKSCIIFRNADENVALKAQVKYYLNLDSNTVLV